MRFIPLVGGALFKNDKLLVVRRSGDKKHFAGKWEIPGGKVEFGEDPVETLKREFREETGLDIGVKAPFNAWQSADNNTKIYFIEVDYMVECKNCDEVRINNGEHSEYKWISDASEVEATDEMSKTIKKAFQLRG
ncbi:NUDIX domain-containing protein [Candidatus Micrarchaeota archaeon]|nr:NUDIX domain-containing protein [Candidatus Micrarchaeota archaeon]